MAIITYEQLSEVPEELREAAQEKDGKYVVNVAPAVKVKEFRDNNVALSQERDKLIAALSQYEGVTGVEAAELEEGKLSDFAKILELLRDTKKRVDDGKLVEETSLEEAAAARVSDVTTSFKSQLQDMARERDAHRERATAAEKRANAMMVENAVRLVASDPDVAMIDKAVAFVLPRALEVFKVEDEGGIVPKEKDGTVIYGHDGMTPMSVKEWLLKEREANTFLFKGPKGGGAAGSAEVGGTKMSYAELQKMRPEERMRLARAGKV